MFTDRGVIRACHGRVFKPISALYNYSPLELRLMEQPLSETLLVAAEVKGALDDLILAIKLLDWEWHTYFHSQLCGPMTEGSGNIPDGRESKIFSK